MSRSKPALPEPPKATKPPIPTRAVTRFLPPWETGTPGPVAELAVGQEPSREVYDFSHIAEKTKAVRRAFVAEFVKDFNGTAALARLGFNYSQPAVVANQWLKEPFTQHVLDQYIRTAEDEALVTRGEIIASLKREANSYGLDSSGASRVSALGKLAKILGLEIDRSEVKVAVAGGIMLVPMAANPDEWEKHAASAQAQLKQAASA